MIETYVITLDPESDRFRRFAQLNAHLDVTVFPGIDGAEVSDADSVKLGFLTPECAASGLVSKGMLGCAISHWTLWWKAIYENKSLLVLEDDVVTHRDIQSWIEQSEICRTADLVLFGINTDSVLEAISPEGMHQASVFGEINPDYGSIAEKLSLTRSSDVRLWRLLAGFGQCCSLVTPHGAAKLVASALPLRLDEITVPLVPNAIAGTGLDRRLNALFATIEAYVAVPFLAWTPNTASATRS